MWTVLLEADSEWVSGWVERERGRVREQPLPSTVVCLSLVGVQCAPRAARVLEASR